MGSKLGWHFQQVCHQEWVNSRFVKIIDPPVQNPFTQCKVIGRTFMPDEQSNALIRAGASGAHVWFDTWHSYYKVRSYVHAWEGPNEPQPMWDRPFRAKLVEFTSTLGRLMHQNGLKFVGLNFSVGWPDVGHGMEFAECVRHCDYIGVHEYSAPAMWDKESWYCLRYRRLYAELRNAGLAAGEIPPFFIGECGIDGGVIGPDWAKKGWRTFTQGNADQYMQELRWYDSQLQRDGDMVAGAVVFTSGPYGDWVDFDVDAEMSKRLHQHIEASHAH